MYFYFFFTITSTSIHIFSVSICNISSFNKTRASFWISVIFCQIWGPQFLVLGSLTACFSVSSEPENTCFSSVASSDDFYCFSALQRKSQRYYPTSLAINLASGLSTVTTDTRRAGYIVVETNYRVYAYTGKLSLNDSNATLSVVTLFCLTCVIVQWLGHLYDRLKTWSKTNPMSLKLGFLTVAYHIPNIKGL